MAQGFLKPPHHPKPWVHLGALTGMTSENRFVLSECLRVTQKAIVQQSSSASAQQSCRDSSGVDDHRRHELPTFSTDYQPKQTPRQKRSTKATIKRILRVRIPIENRRCITTEPDTKTNQNQKKSREHTPTPIPIPTPAPTPTPTPTPRQEDGGYSPDHRGKKRDASCTTTSYLRSPFAPSAPRTPTPTPTRSPRLHPRVQKTHAQAEQSAHSAPTRKDSFTVRGSSIIHNRDELGEEEKRKLLQKRKSLNDRPSPVVVKRNNGDESACANASSTSKSTSFHRRNQAQQTSPAKHSGLSTPFSRKLTTRSHFHNQKMDLPSGSGSGDRARTRLEEPRSKTSTGHYPIKAVTIFKRCASSARPFRRLATTPSSSSSSPSSSSSNDYHRQLQESECLKLSRRLEEVLYSDNLAKFREAFSPFEKRDRKRIVDYKETAGNPNLFFRACVQAKIPFVEFMCEDCSPDLEMTGPFIVQNEDSEHMVTPLWHAAATGNLALLRLLKEAGSDVDTCSNTGSTAVLAACYMSHADVVKYLLANQANAHAANVKGLTCLMSSVHSVTLVRFLLLNGADVNRADLCGNTAMHYAAEKGQLTVIRILHELGGNPFQSNDDGYSVFQIAAKHRRREVMELLIQSSAALRIENIIDVYELFAAMVILLDQDFEIGYTYFFKASTLRYMDKSNPISKRRKQPSELGKFVSMREFNTILELQNCLGDHEELTFQALLVCERQRGWMQDHYLQLLLYCGATFADRMDFRKASNLWKLSYTLTYNKYIRMSPSSPEPFNLQLIKITHSVVKLLYQWRRDDSFGFEISSSDDGPGIVYHRVPESTVREIFILLCDHALAARRFLREITPDLREKLQSSLFLIFGLVLCALLIYLDSFPVPPEGREKEIVLRSIQPLVVSRLEARSVPTLLHMSLLPDTMKRLAIDFDDKLSMSWPSMVIVNNLLLLGSDPTASDESGNTPLHMAASLCALQEMTSASTSLIVEQLLAKGAHPDQANGTGQTPIDWLPPGGLKQRALQRVSLKCLAARAIAKHNIPYVDEIPSTLYSFIELHRT